MQKPGFEEITKNFVLQQLEGSEVEFTGNIAYEAILPYREEALKHITEHAELPGFRKGKVPMDMVLKKVGEASVLEEAIELFVKDFYPALIDAHKINAVGRPEIKITKLAPMNPVGLVVRATVYPEVTLPKNWKKFGESIVQEASLPATDEDVDRTLENIQQSRKKDEIVPELNDEFAKSLGAFDSLAALKEQIKKGIGEEKERAAKDARRGKIIDALLAEVKVEVPKIFIESELEKIMGQMRDDVARFGAKFDEYLKQIKKTEEDLRSEFRAQAEKRAKLQLTLNKIAEEEKVEADKDAADVEIQAALQHFPDANPELVRIHIETVLKNEKVLQLLESAA